MATSHFVLLIETDPAQTEGLAAQLVRIGIEPIRVGDLVEAVDVVQSRAYAVRAILVPAALSGRAVQKALKTLRRAGPILPCMAYGKEPEPAQRKQLRRAGVQLALWDGYDPGMLRFQINRLVCGEHPSSVRGARRAPIHAPVTVWVGGREKEGALYSISEGGCFIETPRASMDGAQLRMRFVLDERHYELDGLVVFSNVPGNLQRPNLPLGMGVRFESVPRSIRKELGRFVHQRISSLEV
jgi:hypothetical protein